MKSELLLATENQIAGEALSKVLNQKGYQVQTQTRNLFQIERVLSGRGSFIAIFEENILRRNISTCLEALQEINPRPKCAFILSSVNASQIINGINDGINGFIHKQSGIDELLNCLSALEDGYSYISPHFSGRIAKFSEPDVSARKIKLTPREHEIVELIKENKTSKEIGKVLNLSYKTVQNHRQNICNKLGLKGRNRLFEYAKDHY